MKFRQLIEYNMRNIFLEKSYSKCGEETRPRPCSKKLKLTISLDQWLKNLYSLFLLYSKLKAIEIIETLLQTTCFHPILSFFEK